MKQKTLAVIGSKGMVGSDLVNYLKPNFELTEIDRHNYGEHEGKTFDVIINANGNSNKIWANENRLGDFETSTISVYKTFLDFTFKVYIYISSFDVYENHEGEKESDQIDSAKLTPYGLHKFLSELIVKSFTKNYIILRCPMMLGTKLKKGPLYDVLNNSKLYISKDSSFQMITTEELAKIIFSLLRKNIKGEIFNIGGKSKVELNKVEELTKKKATSPKDGRKQVYETDISKLNKIFPLKTSEEYLKDFLKEYILKI